MKIFFCFLVVIAIIITARFFMLAKGSKDIPEIIGLKNDRLQDCGNKPNCVSSLSLASDHQIEPIPFSGPSVVALEKLKKIILGLEGLVLRSEAENYLHFTATTKLFGFTDDLEFHLIKDSIKGPLIHVRSASRVGYSDLSANRKRIESIRILFAANN